MKSVLQDLARKSEELEKRRKQQLELGDDPSFGPTYSVGDWVFCTTRWGKAPRLLARVESATPIESVNGDLWCVRCYYSKQRKARPFKGPIPPQLGWSKHVEHRHIDRALNPAEIADLRNNGIIPHAGSAVLP